MIAMFRISICSLSAPTKTAALVRGHSPRTLARETEKLRFSAVRGEPIHQALSVLVDRPGIPLAEERGVGGLEAPQGLGRSAGEPLGQALVIGRQKHRKGH